ncbi:DUF6090 family protein [Algoriphagus namhaensis]
MNRSRSKSFRKYSFEFLSIFIAVIAAFALENWKDYRNARRSEIKILTEIKNGLSNDLLDIEENIGGHRLGLKAVRYFADLLENVPVVPDSLTLYYYSLFRDFVTIQNSAGYETLKSKGLELIENDSLRLNIISLYEYEYSTLNKLEEQYEENQFHKNYFQPINSYLSPYLQFNENPAPVGILQPLNFSEKDKKLLKSMLWKIKLNREFCLRYYDQMALKVVTVQKKIESELEKHD